MTTTRLRLSNTDEGPHRLFDFDVGFLDNEGISSSSMPWSPTFISPVDWPGEDNAGVGTWHLKVRFGKTGSEPFSDYEVRTRFRRVDDSLSTQETGPWSSWDAGSTDLNDMVFEFDDLDLGPWEEDDRFIVDVEVRYAGASSHDGSVFIFTGGPAEETGRSFALIPEPITINDLIADDITTGSPTLDSPEINQIHDLGANALSTGLPTLDNPELSQVHIFAVNDLSTGSPTIGSPTLGQVVTLQANALSTGVPTLDNPEFNQEHDLEAITLSTGFPTLDSPEINQIHDLEAVGITSGTPTMGMPSLSQGHLIVVLDLDSAAPTLDSPGLEQIHALTANDLSAGVVTLGSPTLSQVVDLIASPLDVGVPDLGAPTIGQGHIVTAQDLSTGSPTLDSPEINQVHALDASDLTLPEPVLGSPVLSIGTHNLTILGLTTGEPTIESPLFGQEHDFVAQDLTTGEPDLGSPELNPPPPVPPSPGPSGPTQDHVIGNHSGFVLQAPKVSQSNSPFGGEPETLVREKERTTYLSSVLNPGQSTEYMVSVANTGNLVMPDIIVETAQPLGENRFGFNVDGFQVESVLSVDPVPDDIDTKAGIISYNANPGSPVIIEWEPLRLGINWTKNDNRKRFGYVSPVQRWDTLVGTSPDFIDTVPLSFGEIITLPVIEEDGILILQSPDISAGQIVPLTYVGQATFDLYVTNILTIDIGEGIVNQESGDVLLAADLISDFSNEPVYFYRHNFLDHGTGQIGLVGDPLFLNPIPQAGEYPRIRVLHRSFLRGQSSVISTVPSGFDFVWHPTTGMVTLSSDILTDLEDMPVYYMGVFLNDTPVLSYSPTDLGVLDASDSFATTGLGTIDFLDYDPDALLLYTESGSTITNIIMVDGPFTASLNLPVDTAEVNSVTGAVQLSLRFRSLHEGQIFRVGTFDFPIEKGISFRLPPSPAGPSALDGIHKSRVRDSIIEDSIPSGPSYTLSQVPLQDIGGYAPNTFFRIERGARKRTMNPDIDIIYDFDNRSVLWAQPEVFSAVLPGTTYSVQLPHQVLHDREITFELNTGSGFQPVDDSFALNRDTGTAIPVERSGQTLASLVVESIGVATLESAEDLTTFLDPITDPLLAPHVVFDTQVIRIASFTANTITLQADHDISIGEKVRIEILEAPEIIYLYGLQEKDFRQRTVFPYLVLEDTTGILPQGYDDVFFRQGDTDLPHVELSPQILGDVGDTLTLPAYYQSSFSVYDIYVGTETFVFTPGVPDPGEYTITGTEIELSASDLADLEGTQVILDPALSVGRPTGPVEILTSTQEIGLPDDVSQVDLYLLIPEDQYSQADNVLFLNFSLSEGGRLFVRYVSNDTMYEELGGFKRVENLGKANVNIQNTFADGIDVDVDKPAFVLVNGARDPQRAIDLIAKTVDVSGIRSGRQLEVSYYSTAASQGDTLARINHSPTPAPFVLREGTSQEFQGNQTSVLFPGVFVQAGPYSFRIVSSNFDGQNTTVSITPGLPQDLIDPLVFVSDASVLTATSFIPNTLLPVVAGGREIQLVGETQIRPGTLLFLDGDPYYVEISQAGSGITRVTFSSQLVRDYDSSTVTNQTDYPVYLPGTSILRSRLLAVTQEPTRLIKMENTGKGIIVPDTGYNVGGSGEVLLEPALVDPPQAPQVWYLSYTGISPIEPAIIAGQTFLPRIRASYTRRINATHENGLAGSRLLASYDFYSPDTFYFRNIRMSDFVPEIFDGINPVGNATGNIVRASSPIRLQDYGVETPIFQGVWLRDEDRAARAILYFYNTVITKLENILEVIDGRVIGDEDGKFLFDLKDDDTPGGIDPVTGELIPYYANPLNPGVKPTPSEIAVTLLEDQIGAVQNFIDDVIMVSKKPFRLNLSLPLTFFFDGTFRSIWEPSRLSRLYPEQRKAFSITAPTLSSGSDYRFPTDFRRILSDLGQTDILTVEDVRKRPARARVFMDGVSPAFDGGGGEFRIMIASEYDPDTGEFSNAVFNPTTPIPEIYAPSFEVGDHVSLGRVVYSKTGDVIERDIDVYGENLVVTSVGTDYIEIRSNPEIANADFNDIEMTNANTLDPLIGDTIFTVPPVADSGFTSGDDTPPSYRIPLDASLNASEGELTNVTLPRFIGNLLGQSRIPPETFIEAVVSYKNNRTEPFRAPTLDGQALNDDLDTSLPLVSPLEDSEIRALPRKGDAFNAVLTDTTEGLVLEGTVLDTVTIEVTQDLTLLSNPPERFDLLIIEDEVDGLGDSIRFTIGDVTPTTVVLASFFVPGVANFVVENIISGTGERNSMDTSRWDAPFDFTLYDGASAATLYVFNGVTFSAYTVDTLNVNFVTTTAPIAEVGPEIFYLEVEGTGSIPSELDRITAADIDFSQAQGSVVITGSGRNNGTYTAAGGGSDFLLVETIPLGTSGQIVLGISNAAEIATGSGSVDIALNTMQTYNPVNDVKIGHTLVIEAGNVNAGRYTVTDIFSGVPNEIQVTPNFFMNVGDSGAVDMPMSWKVKNPRRFSSEMEDMQQTLIRSRVLYARNDDSDGDIAGLLSATSLNPAAPLKDRFEELLDFAFDSILSDSADIVAATSTMTGLDFEAEGVNPGDFLIIRSGPNTGFFPILSITSVDIEISESNLFTMYALADETDVTFEIYRNSTFLDRTAQLIFYDYINVLFTLDWVDNGIRVSTHNPFDLEGEGLTERPGDPEDALISIYISLLDDRADRVQNDIPNVRQEITAILKGSESLYDIRYAWIDYRTNLESGTLPRRRRFRDQIEKLRQERRKRILQLLAAGTTQ